MTNTTTTSNATSLPTSLANATREQAENLLAREEVTVAEYNAYAREWNETPRFGPLMRVLPEDKLLSDKALRGIVRVSKGNMKLGGIPSLSLPPIKTCRPDAPCRKECYAMKAWRLYPSVRESYTKNLDSFQADPARYFTAVATWIAKKKPAFFRFNVSGDIPSQRYLDGLTRVARLNPDTTFLVFTKRYEIDFTNIPANLRVVLAAWPGRPMANPHGLPVAYMRDTHAPDARIPSNALACPGSCENCNACWFLADVKRDVVFDKH